MNPRWDYKNYRAPLGTFQVIEGSLAFLLLMGLAVGCLIFAPYL